MQTPDIGLSRKVLILSNKLKMNKMKDRKISVVPANYTSVTPWIISPSSTDLIKFLTVAFGAEEIQNSRITREDGLIIHVVVKIGNAMVMLFDSRDGWAATPSNLNLYVADLEATYQKARESGAKSVTDITPLWFGEKVARILDPFGNLWWLNERIEEVDFTNPEVFKRASTPEAVKGITYVQKSLDVALKAQKIFFEK